jgi:hypothetical protein
MGTSASFWGPFRQIAHLLWLLLTAHQHAKVSKLVRRCIEHLPFLSLRLRKTRMLGSALGVQQQRKNKTMEVVVADRLEHVRCFRYRTSVERVVVCEATWKQNCLKLFEFTVY